MRGILLASHGKLALGMKDTLEIFYGKIEQLDTLILEKDQSIVEFGDILRYKIDALDYGDGVTVFCDLAFGTPSNETARLLANDCYKDRVTLVTGMNLPMLLEYCESRKYDQDIKEVLEIGKQGIIDFNDRLKK